MISQSQNKLCGTCKENKSVAEFPFRNQVKGTVRSICKYCANKANRAIQRKHKDKYAPIKAKNYRDNRAARLAQTANRRKNIRQAVLDAYGNKCNCCSETEPDFLTLEHKNKDGAKHRKSVGGSATAIYKSVIESGFPSSFTILCYNCNCSQKNGNCYPHKRK